MSANTTGPKAVNLRCEYLVNPLGIDQLSPRLSWIFQDPATSRNAAQNAYRIVTAASQQQLDSGEFLHDTGKIQSSACNQISYGGPELSSAQRVWWKLKVWNAADQESNWSEHAFWEMGLLENSAWQQTKWIGPQPREDIYVSYPAPLVRKQFAVDGQIASARLYITARGLYAASINGQRAGCDELTPGWTDYHKRLQYNTYDVTDLLAQGKNAIGVTLADGWYCGNMADFATPHRGRYGRDPQLLAQLVITLKNGNTNTIVTDESWRWINGPYTIADIYKGERYDQRLEQNGFDTADFNDSDWKNVDIYDSDNALLIGKQVEAVRVIEQMKPIEITKTDAGDYIFDMGQNMVGRVKTSFNTSAGQTITMRHAEVLNPDGTIYTENLRSADQMDTYTAAADGRHTYSPAFTFHGFRYFQITGLDYTPQLEDVTGEVMHNAMAPTGSFECSDTDLNQLQHNIIWGQKGNYLEVPTDCPQRDERLGWTGDAQVFARTGAFNFDIAAFYTKWLADMDDSQFEDGNIPFVVPDTLSIPEKGRFAAGAAAWGDAAVICPWTIYLCYGDKRILETHYDMMDGWMSFQKNSCRGLIRPSKGFGDWLAMDAPGRDNAQTATPKDLVGTAYFAYTASIMAKVACILGKNEDVKRYEKLSSDVKAAFCEEFVTPTGRVMGDTQTSYSMALNMDLLDESLRKRAADMLVADIEAHKDHITTGFVGVNQIMFALTAAGKLEHNYRLLFQDTYPSWLMPVKNGATTIWERWDGWTPDKGFQDKGMNSFNHYAYGCVGEWLYRCCAGLDLDESCPGYEHIIIKPHPDPTARMTWAKAGLESVRGRIESGWKTNDDGSLNVDVRIPANANATVILNTDSESDITESGQPLSNIEGIKNISCENGQVKIEIGSGCYSFNCKA